MELPPGLVPYIFLQCIPTRWLSSIRTLEQRQVHLHIGKERSCALSGPMLQGPHIHVNVQAPLAYTGRALTCRCHLLSMRTMHMAALVRSPGMTPVLCGPSVLQSASQACRPASRASMRCVCKHGLFGRCQLLRPPFVAPRT